jgi:signal transduction histidine kinase/CheY-like chemotaxis protein
MEMIRQHKHGTDFQRRCKHALRAFCPICIFVIVLIAEGTSLVAAREVTVGVYENPPKVFTHADGKPAGIFVDIVEEIAQREDWTLRYVHGSWPQCLERLESGAIDLMVDVAYSRERAGKYDFCEDDVIANWAQVYTRRGVKIKLITDLEGLRLATLRQGIHLSRFKDLAEGFGFSYDLTLVDTYESVFRMLQEERVDAGIVNRVYGYANEDQYKVIRSPVVFSPTSLRFAVQKGENADVILAIDRRLREMKKEKASVYHQSLKRWLGETTKLRLPYWIGWSLGAAAGGLLLLFLMSLLLRHQVNKKTAYLRLANAELEKQVHETMKAHLDLKRSEEALIRQERLSALGRLTSGIAHDFNNMLIPILGYSDLLLENPDLLKDPQKALSMLESIQASACTSRDTVKRLQEFRGADPTPGMESVRISELVSEVVEATRPLWKSQREAHSIPTRIIEDVVPLDLTVTLSKSQFSEALMNLLLNALDAVSSGGEVTIRAFVDNDETFALEVRDTGVGMSESVARQCLEPFFSTKGKDGTGIGLAMVHGIVKRHKGELSIDTSPESGTTIAMRIPLDLEAPRTKKGSEGLSRAARSLRILVVDDDANSRLLISEHLALDGHSVTLAADAPEGIAEFQSGEFDLVITDRAMPEISGDELARYVKASELRVPVLMITGFALMMASQGEHPAGVDYVMGKPFTVQELRDAIDRTISLV